MNTIASLKNYVSTALSSSPLVDRVNYIFHPNTDTHFFQIVGVDIYAEPDLLDIIGTIYEYADEHHKGVCIAIVDESSLQDFNGAELVYNSYTLIKPGVFNDFLHYYSSILDYKKFQNFGWHDYNTFINLEPGFDSLAAEPILQYRYSNQIGNILLFEDDYYKSFFGQLQDDLKANLKNIDPPLSVDVENSLCEFEMEIEYLQAA